MLYHCDICDHWQNTRKIETPFGKSPVPYVAVVDDLSGAKGYACADCVANEIDTLGKFSAYRHERHSMGTALVLYTWSMNSGEDKYMSSEGWGYCAQFGRYLLFTDTQGFVTYEDCDTVKKSQKEFDRLYALGWGADESDAYISSDRGK